MAERRLVLVLSENWTMTSARDLPLLVQWAREAEDAGVDAVMVSEHIALGTGADEAGRPANPREYALPGNQDPATPWPNSLLLLAAIASATTRLRLVAAGIIAPLRHPLAMAQQLATLDLLSEGRLVVQPIVSWHRPEYVALGVPYERRGVLLDQHLEAWELLWRHTPATFDGPDYRFTDVCLEPKPFRSTGPTLWFGGSSVHPRLIRRMVKYGHGFNPLGRPTSEDMAELRGAMADAGRDMAEIEMVGGVRGVFPDAMSVADLGASMAGIRPQLDLGFTTFCAKPSQFTDDPAEVGSVCRELVSRLSAM